MRSSCWRNCEAKAADLAAIAGGAKDGNDKTCACVITGSGFRMKKTEIHLFFFGKSLDFIGDFVYNRLVFREKCSFFAKPAEIHPYIILRRKLP